MVFWTNPNGGDWDTDANWSAGTKPGATDDAIIDTAGITVTHNQNQNDSVNSLTSQAALSISNGTLSLASDSTLSDALTLSGGTLTGTGTVTVSGLLTWSGGTMSGPSATSADGGLMISTSASKTLDTRTLNNSAAATWSGTGMVLCNHTCAFNNLATATFDDQVDASWQQSLGTGGSFSNAGSFTKSAGAATATFGITFNNTGTVAVHVGTVTLSENASFGGHFAIQDGTINATSGTVTFLDGAAGTGTGTLTIAGATGTVGSSASASLQNLTLASGTLTGAGTLTIQGLLTWSGGTMSGTGVTNADGGLTINTTFVKTLDTRTLNNATAATSSSSINCNNACTFNNLTGASFDDQVGIFWLQSFGTGGRFNNAGSFATSAVTHTAVFSIAFNNSGTVAVQTGTLNLANGGTDTGRFTLATSAVLNLSGGTFTINATPGVSGAGSMNLSGGTVNVVGTFTVTTSLTLSGGTLTGAGAVTVSGLLTWSGGTMSGSGITDADGGLTLSGGTLDTRTLNNAGEATLSGTGIRCSSSCTFNNLARASFDDQTDASWGQSLGMGGSFNNAGTFTKSGSIGTTTFRVAFNNSGTVAVQTGTLSVIGGGTGTGSFVVEAQAGLNFGGTHHLDAGSRVSGAGSVSFGSGTTSTVNVAGSYNITGSTSVLSGSTVSFTGAVAGVGPLTINGGTADFGSNDISAPTLTLSGGTLAGTGAVTVSGLLTWNGGTMRGAGVTNADGGLIISPTGTSVGVLDTRTLNNTGEATLSGTGFVYCDNACAFNNLIGASFDDQVDDIWIQRFGTGGRFSNAGSFTKSAGTSTADFSVAFDNTGTTSVQAGTLSLRGGGTSTGSFMVAGGTMLDFSGGTHDLTTDSSISGAGTVSFSGFTGSATVNVTGSYDVTGSTSVLSGSMVNFTGAVAGVGTLTISGGTVDFGSNDIATTTLTLSDGTLTGTGTVTVSGLLTWSGGTMSGTGTTNADGGLTISTNAFKFLDTRTLNNAGDTIWSGAGTVFCNFACTFNNLALASFDDQVDAFWQQNLGTGGSFNNAGSFTKSAGADTATFSVTFTNSGTFAVQVGSVYLSCDFDNAGTLVVGPSSTLAEAGMYSQTGTVNILAAGTLTLQGSFTNFQNGQTLKGGTYDILGTFQFTGANIVTNRAALILDGPDAQILDENGTNGLANLARNTAGGILTIQNGANLTTASDFNNHGTLTIGADSTFTVNGTYTTARTGFTTLDGGTLAATILVSIRQGGTLSGTGTISASVQNAGQILVGGTGTTGVLTVLGDFTQTSAGSLTLAIGGPMTETDYDQLAISGAATLDGTLNVDLINGFLPPSGSTYQVLTFASASGTFATLNIDPSFLPPIYDPTDVTLQAM